MSTGTLIELVRFGYGPVLQDGFSGTGFDADTVLDQLRQAGKPIPRDGLTTLARLDLLSEIQLAAKAAKMGGSKENIPLKAIRALGVQELSDWVWDSVVTPTGFEERLMNFWANRLSVAWRKGVGAYFIGPYREEAIRPHIAGNFEGMLAASAWHPAMLEYLDQIVSVGPESTIGKKQHKGLNENYSREFLELHCMGHGYDQTDVTELAKLFAGMQYGADGQSFDDSRAQPGPKMILGQSFGSGREEIARVIQMVARRPETADSIARALAKHFIADTPPESLVSAMAQTYLEHDTALMPVYRVLLDHPSASDPVFTKLRSPHEYLVATLRALGAGVDLAESKGRPKVVEALAAMAQPVFRAPGPDGWPDTVGAWLTAPGLAARLNWAETLARRFGDKLEPATLARSILGDEGTAIAAGRAEQRWEGVAVVLGSPDFMRR